ncbi:isoprenoid synthase domain-containing protein [Lanmaoa asiatica]|nr:isoprenoid synthase domain-containing protein [Lanmaoa asiatica]
MPTKAYRLPDLLALLPEKLCGEINPHFKEVEAAFNAWVEKTLGGPRAVEVSQCENPLCIAVIYPLASQLQLKGIVDYTAATFLFDDLLHVSFYHSFHMCSCNPHSDRSPSEDVPALSRLWMKILDGNEGKSVQHPLIEIMRSELLVGIRPLVGTFHWPQFITENEMAVKNMIQETHEREVYQNNNTILDIQSYMVNRRFRIGCRPFFVLLRATRCLYIPDDVLASPIVQEMENAITDIISISNDVHSFKKEYGVDGAFSNLLTVIQKDPETAHLDFQGRLDYAEELFKAALDRFQACRQELPSLGPEMDQYLTVYADGLIDWAIGNLQWSRVTSRYNRFTNDEDRRNNIVRLALDGSPANKNHVPAY